MYNIGDKVRVIDDFNNPNFHFQNLYNWTGSIESISININNDNYLKIKLDDKTLNAMTQSYKDLCESSHEFYDTIIISTDKVSKQ